MVDSEWDDSGTWGEGPRLKLCLPGLYCQGTLGNEGANTYTGEDWSGEGGD